MSGFEMIDTLRHLGRSATCVLGLTALSLTAPSVSHGQAFYNGMPGPKATQIDARYTTGQSRATVIPKAFATRIDEDLPPLMAAASTTISRDGVVNQGVLAGAYTDSFLGGHAVGSLGLFRGASNEYTTVSPQAYYTATTGDASLDAQVTAFYDTETGSMNASTALTGGYRVSEDLHLGATVEKHLPGSYDYGARARYDITDTAWVEADVDHEDVSLRFVANF